METLYRKVETEDRLPTENNQYYTSNGLLDFCIRNGKGDFWDENDDFELYPHYWLEEIPDTTAQLKAEKAELLEALEEAKQFLNYVQSPATPAIRLRMEIESLIQKHKQ